MACNKISALPAASVSLTGAEVAPVVQGNVTRKMLLQTIAQAATYYSSSVNYEQGHYVRGVSSGVDDNIYRAVQDSLGQNLTNAAYWHPVLINEDMELSVPSQYASINAAFEYIKEAWISQTATVTIQVADGAYALTTTQINLNHPCGDRIQLIGNTTTPASVSLSFTTLPTPPTSPYLLADSGSIYLNNGGSFGLIDGFAITKTGGAPVFGHNAIYSYGSRLNVGANMVITGFYGGLAAQNGSLVAAGTGSVSPIIQPGTAGYAIYAVSARIEAPFVEINGTANGVFASGGSEVRLNSITTASGLSTVFVLNNASIVADSASIGAATTFYSVTDSATVSDTGASYGASTQDVTLDGTLQYRTSVALASAISFDLSLLAAGTVQRILGTGAKVFLSANGIDTTAANLTLRAGGTAGLTVANSTGAATANVSLAIASTAAITGIVAGTGVLDGAGQLVVNNAAITANSIPVALSAGGSFSGKLEANTVIPGAVTFASEAGPADGGLSIYYQIICYA